MKIVLANLPWKVGDRWGVRAGSRWPHIKASQEGDYLPFPFFLAYAAALLKKNGYEVYLIDAIAEKLPCENFINKVKKIAPDFIVAETSTVSTYNDMSILQKLHKSMKIIVCGPDINITKKEFLEGHRFIDYVLVGEYEMILLDLMEHLKKSSILDGVKGIIYREDTRIIKNPERPLLDNLDLLPWPMRESLPMERYYDVPGGLLIPSVQMVASRGCPFQCIFCAWPQIIYKKGSYRTRSIKDVVDEMEYLVNYFGFKSIYFDDDTWNIGKERILEFCKDVSKRGEDGRLRIPWAIMARADLMDENQLTVLKKAGLYAVKYGIESADQDILNKAKKSMDLKKTEHMVKLTMAMGIKTHLTFTFGLPGETRATIEKTINYALKLNPTSAQFSITTPYPGTDYFMDLEKEGRIITKDWSEYDGNYKSVFYSNLLTAEELVYAKERACTAWEYHCRYREPNYDFPVKILAAKFWRYILDKGALYSFYKTYDYLKFIVKRSDWYQRHSMHKIEKGRFKILYGLGKVKIFWNEIELTKGVGFNTSISIYGNWFDSSQSDWHIVERSKEGVVIASEWKYLPIRQIWRLNIVNEGTIDWKIENIYKEDIEFDTEKVGIMLSEKYSDWIAGDKNGKFKISRNWQEINLKDTSKKEVGARSLFDSMFPDIMLDFSSDGMGAIPQIQSSSRDLNAIFIYANFNRPSHYKAGKYDFFKGRIYIKEAI
ncbi:MAG: radical SAM protein [Candidatus Omnitrophica bacterium]|nr:radical SAM protein [Candidatus Omnitrophota bacterium]